MIKSASGGIDGRSEFFVGLAVVAVAVLMDVFREFVQLTVRLW